jgi:tRNA (guanine-N7-)-methyltransferase
VPASTFRREPVSFVQRDSRLSASSQSAWDAHSGRFVLDVPRAEARTSVAESFRFDPVDVFGRCAPLVLEIGSGSGDAVVEAAARHPGWDFLAVEVYRPGVAQTLTRLGASGATNVRLVQANAVDVLRTALEGVRLREVWTFFPDPWPKAKHHKRRLVTPATAALVAGRLAPGGRWRLATDWPDYAEQMLEAGAACPLLSNPYGGFAPRYEGRPVTRFEGKGLAVGRPIADLTFERCPG